VVPEFPVEAANCILKLALFILKGVEYYKELIELVAEFSKENIPPPQLPPTP
jgi:hypothetical protein